MNPAGRIPPQPWMTHPASVRVLRALARPDAPARFVGGCVRDAVAGRPVKDIDIATPLGPAVAMRELTDAGVRVVPTGIDHGTITAVTGGRHFEITSLRRDVETFGRHARVAFTDDWAADAARRDFTFNAMFCDADGTLYDPTGGLDDLRAGRVRFVGDARTRIEEDVLRLLRFFRFYAHYGRPPPDAEALDACRALAGRLPTLSAERVWAELSRLLLAPDPAPVFTLMAETGVLDHALPEARDIDRLSRLSAIEGGAGAEPDAVRRLAALLDGDDVAARALAARLRMSNAERDRLVGLAATAGGGALDGVNDPAAARRALYRMGAERVRDLALIGWAAAGGQAEDARWRMILAEASGWQVVRLPVQGRDAVALGVLRGPAVGALIAAVEGWWVANDFRPGRDECLAELARLAGLAQQGDAGGGA